MKKRKESFERFTNRMVAKGKKTLAEKPQHTEDCQDANDDTSVLKGDCICTHTPGPWTTDSEIISSEDGFVAKVASGGVPGTVWEANARLIASAPSLLRLAKGFLGAIDDRISLLEEAKAENQADEDIDDQIAHWKSYRVTVENEINKAEGRS